MEAKAERKEGPIKEEEEYFGQLFVDTDYKEITW